jgi:prefoldin subunit 5
VKDLDDRFAEIEKRVKMLITQNKDLKSRIKELDLKLMQVQREAQQVEHFHGKKMHIKEKIEQILHTLETAKDKE